MNGKLNMRRNIKEPTEFNTSNLDESIVSEETVNSGNYNDAKKIPVSYTHLRAHET